MVVISIVDSAVLINIAQGVGSQETNTACGEPEYYIYPYSTIHLAITNLLYA